MSAHARVVIVVQARTGSTRLPGKVLLPILGRPVLLRQLERIAAAREFDELVVATTTLAEDDPIAELCQREGLACFRGHPTDLLDRHYQAGLAFRADAVVKIPSDCPLIDPAVIDRVLSFWRQNAERYDYVSNLHPPSYPDGNDVEVIPMPILELAWRLATKPYEREHTTPFIWDQPERFRIGNVTWETGWDYSRSHRWTLDYPEDYAFVRAVYEALYPYKPLFSLWDILKLLEERPELAQLNARYAGVNWYRHHLGELRTITPEDTRIPQEEQPTSETPR